MSKYYSIREFSKILGVSAQTLRNWDSNGKLKPHHTSSNGYRYYSHEQLNQVMNTKPNLDRKIIGYCRVSSNKQKDDLERQVESMRMYNVHACQDTNLEILSYDSFPDLSCISNKAKVDFCWCFVIIALMPSFIIVVINVLFRQGFYLRNSFWIH